MSEEAPVEKPEIWFLRLEFDQAVKSLQQVQQQLCAARDDSYHRARAEAKNEAYEKVISLFVNALADRLGDRS